MFVYQRVPQLYPVIVTPVMSPKCRVWPRKGPPPLSLPRSLPATSALADAPMSRYLWRGPKKWRTHYTSPILWSFLWGKSWKITGFCHGFYGFGVVSPWFHHVSPWFHHGRAQMLHIHGIHIRASQQLRKADAEDIENDDQQQQGEANGSHGSSNGLHMEKPWKNHMVLSIRGALRSFSSMAHEDAKQLMLRCPKKCLDLN